jgi:hypothetical protein
MIVVFFKVVEAPFKEEGVGRVRAGSLLFP